MTSKVKDFFVEAYEVISHVLPGQLAGVMAGHFIIYLEVNKASPSAFGLSAAAALPVFVLVNKLAKQFLPKIIADETITQGIAATCALTVGVFVYVTVLSSKELLVYNLFLSCASLALWVGHEKVNHARAI